jgi:hypothetical protein
MLVVHGCLALILINSFIHSYLQLLHISSPELGNIIINIERAIKSFESGKIQTGLQEKDDNR